jgi:predicted dehydrogenase
VSPDGAPEPPKAPLRLVQVGAGAMGRAWLRTIRDSADAQLVALVDLDVATARRAAADNGLHEVPVATSLPDVLEQVVADAVVDVTVPTAHRAVSTSALRAGLPVLSEKPLADTVSSGLVMIAAAERSGRLLMVSQSRRYFRQLTAFRQLISGIGTPGLVSCEFFKEARFGGFREQMAYPLLIDMAIHQFDLARDLIGREPVAVQCESFNPPWSWFTGDASAQVMVEFEGGTRFSFVGSWCSIGLDTSWNGSWRVSGPEGTASWDGDGAPIGVSKDGAVVRAQPGEGPEEIAGALAEFVGAVRTGSVPSGEARSNVHSLAMVEAAVRSAEESRRVLISEVLLDAYQTALADERDPDLRAALAGWPSVQDAVAST